MGKNYIDTSDTVNWNVADSYSKVKIMRLLANIDTYIEISEFGAIEIGEEFSVPENIKNMARLKSIMRLAKTLEMLIRNTRFAVKKDDKEVLQKMKEDIIRIIKIMPTLSKKIRNDKEGIITVKINEERFEQVLFMLKNLAEQLLEPLNKADLIFMSDDAIDPDELKRRILEDMVHGG